MNSVHLFVRDSVGATFLDTFTANTAENIAQFRKHATACKSYWQTAEYRKRVPSYKWPCFPVTVCVEEYEDATATP